MIRQNNKILMIPILASSLLLGGCESLPPADGRLTPRYPVPPLDDDETSGMNEEEVKQALKEIAQLAKDGENKSLFENFNTWQNAGIRQRKLLDRLKELKENAGVSIDGESSE